MYIFIHEAEVYVFQQRNTYLHFYKIISIFLKLRNMRSI